MKVKTSDLKGRALDWAACSALGNTPVINPYRFGRIDYGIFDSELGYLIKSYHKDWDQAGPIIEQNELCVGFKHQADHNYCPINDPATRCWARNTAGGFLTYGPTPLIAAMRCFVASRLGDEAEIPEDLLCTL